jgi:hypothetical protein
MLRSALRAAALRGTIVGSALLSAAATTASAQVPGQAGAFAPAGPSHIISTNPFLPLFGYFSAEYEQRIKDNVAFALSGSSVEYDERITHLDAKVRLYPNDRALEGFSVATSLGIAWIRRNDQACDFFGDCIVIDAQQRLQQRRRTFTTPSFAIEGAYQWLLGRSRSTAIIAGFGAKRYLGGSRADFQGISRVLPTGRLSIGYGF